jgi:hypothetical protein
MYHLRMDIGSGNVLVRMDFISFYPLDQSCPRRWTNWVLGIGDVCLFVRFSDLFGTGTDDRFNYVIDTYLWSAASALAAMSTSPPLLPIYTTNK